MGTTSLSPLASLDLRCAASDVPLSTARTLENYGDRSIELWKMAGECVGLSGRAVRKLPFLALAYAKRTGRRNFSY